jgi:hypothetical protein
MKDRVPDLDDLLRQIELDELSETAHQKEGEQRTDFSTGNTGNIIVIIGHRNFYKHLLFF